MGITKKQAQKLRCLTLLDLAKADPVAAREIDHRAGSWETCAVGEMAKKLNVNPNYLYSADPKIIIDCWRESTTRLESLGLRFATEVAAEQFGRARRTYHVIARRVKRLFGTKAKRVKLGLEEGK